MRCRPPALAAALLLALALCLVPATPASAQVGGVSSTSAVPAGGDSPTTTEAPPAAEIIPKPNSGVAPTDAGDRGGGLQTVVFFLVIGGTAFMAFLVWRQSKKARAERGF